MKIWGKKMNRKLLIGSILILTFLLLMPSIPAIQRRVVKENIKDKILSELPENLDFNDIKELVDSGKLDKVKHPLLYFFVILVAEFRWWRCIILGDIAIEYGWEWSIEIKYPILFVRCMWLLFRLEFWAGFWDRLSDTLGWNWEDI